jgi:hypothetical protein
MLRVEKTEVGCRLRADPESDVPNAMPYISEWQWDCARLERLADRRNKLRSTPWVSNKVAMATVLELVRLRAYAYIY